MDQTKIIKVAAVAAVGLLAFSFLGKGSEEETIGGSGSFGGFGGGGTEETIGADIAEAAAPFNITFPEIPTFNIPSGSGDSFIIPDSSSFSTGGTPEATDNSLVSTVENTPKKVITSSSYDSKGDAASYSGGGSGAIKGDSLGSKLIKLITAPATVDKETFSSGTSSNKAYDLTGVDVKGILASNTKKEAAMAATVPSYLTQASVDYNKNTTFEQQLKDSGLLKSSSSKTSSNSKTSSTKSTVTKKAANTASYKEGGQTKYKDDSGKVHVKMK